jgi:CRISPR-associated exonuclease Cas4
VDTALTPMGKGKDAKGTGRSSSEDINPSTWKQTAILFLIIAGGLAFNGASFMQPADTEILSRIYMITALLWLIGTMALLYLVLRQEEQAKNKLETMQEGGNEPKKSKFKLGKSEYLVLGFAVVATLLAVNGLTIQHRELIGNYDDLGQIIIVLAALWMGGSFVFFYMSIRRRMETSRIARDIKKAPTETKKFKVVEDKIQTLPHPEKTLSYNWSRFITLVAIILGVNTILIRYGPQIMSQRSEIFSRFLMIISILWLAGAFIFLLDVLKNTELANEIRRLYGIYQGKIEYMDKLDDKSIMLYSDKYKIRGKPDYIVKNKGSYIPVEIKTGKIPRGPHFSHILQIAAYCLLIDEKYNKRPPFGIISYGQKKDHKIKYDSKLEDLLKEKMTDMRKCIEDNAAHRNHHRVGKCRSCSRNKECSERLD